MSALHGLFARTTLGRERLRADWQKVIPATFPAPGTEWHFDADSGLLLHRAEVDAQGRALAGAITGDSTSWLSRLTHAGADALAEQRGDFAIAYWDAQRHTLQLIRDPVGQRSLFLRDDGDVAVFCSELTPLLDDPAFDCRLDLESAQFFLSFGLPLLGRTLAQGVACLPAGHILQWLPGRPALMRRYFTPLDLEQRKVADAEWQDHVVSTLDDAIHAVAGDGRGALLLSGGVDSSYIATTCAARHGGQGYDAYTIEFVGGDVDNEVEHARLVADATGISHHSVRMEADDARKALAPVLTQAEPCSAWAALTHHHLMQHIAADGHAHLLSGLGADEVFGGYGRYLQHYKLLRRQAERWNVPDVDAFDGLTWQAEQARRDLFPGVPLFFDRTARREGMHAPYAHWHHVSTLVQFYRECRTIKRDAHLFEMMVAHECQHRVPDLLFAGFEPIARAAAITTHYPFLDPEVVRVACALGASERFWISGRRWKNKKLLRRIALQRLPAQIITRPPASYTTPIRAWLADPAFGGELRERLHASTFWDQGLVRREWLDGLHVQLQSGTTPGCRGLQVEQYWILTVLSAWVDRWVRPQSRRRKEEQ